MRFRKWVKTDRGTIIYNELKHRSPGVVNVEYAHHIAVFVLLPFTILIFSIILNLYSISYFGTELATLYINYGGYYDAFIIGLYIVSAGVASYFVYIVWKHFKELKNGQTVSMVSNFKTWLKTDKAWKAISISIIIVLTVMIVFFLQLFHRSKVSALLKS